MTPPTKLSQEIVQQLEKTQAAPKPRWHFLLRNYVIWSLGAVSVVLGGVSVSVMIYMLQSNDWEIFIESNNPVLFMLGTLPYFWAGLLALMVGVALYNVRHTKTGYRYHGYTVILASIVVSVLLGVGLFASGVGRAVDHVLEDNIPVYSSVFVRKAHLHATPEHGLLAGAVHSVGDDSIRVIDIDGKEWTVLLERLREQDEEYLEHARIGAVVVMHGEQIDDTTFEALGLKSRPDAHPFGPKGKLRRPDLDDDDHNRDDELQSQIYRNGTKFRPGSVTP